jgi:hypothetical protein
MTLTTTRTPVPLAMEFIFECIVYLLKQVELAIYEVSLNFIYLHKHTTLDW